MTAKQSLFIPTLRVYSQICGVKQIYPLINKRNYTFYLVHILDFQVNDSIFYKLAYLESVPERVAVRIK